MKRLSFFLVFALSAFIVFGQVKKKDNPNDRKVNFGIKGGFNSSMYLVSELKIGDVKINEIQNNYKIGYFSSIFMRFNINKHFIQPELSYAVSKCEIEFDKLGSHDADVDPDYALVNSTIHSVEMPILYGYNIVKQGPYGMSVMIGPKIRYIWNKKNKITFENFNQEGIKEELYPFNISGVVGVGVNISRIYFDFRYELGFHNISKSITSEDADGNEEINSIIFKRRDNMLSFSLGLIF
ncbi:porin family protein [uncultured Bacteroides sp.]|uniref:porin family protein n=1 Tax=uncultured Bacteroides sp. TaxID=162156 RepID=UPI002AA7CB0B|nr:porin family protein [uncultured Bacteroides sp.]